MSVPLQDDLFPFDFLNGPSDSSLVQLPDLNQLPEFDGIDTYPVLPIDSAFLDAQEASENTAESHVPSDENNSLSTQLLDCNGDKAVVGDNCRGSFHLQNPDDVPGDPEIPTNVPAQPEFINPTPTETALTTVSTDFIPPNSSLGTVPLDVPNLLLLHNINQSHTGTETSATKMAHSAPIAIDAVTQNEVLPSNSVGVDNTDKTNTANTTNATNATHPYMSKHDIQSVDKPPPATVTRLDSRVSTSLKPPATATPHAQFLFPHIPITVHDPSTQLVGDAPNVVPLNILPMPYLSVTTPTSSRTVHPVRFSSSETLSNENGIAQFPSTPIPRGTNDITTKMDPTTPQAVTQGTSTDCKTPKPQTPKRPRLRFSRNAPPSNYCHICGRCGNKVDIFQCTNVPIGLCRKVLCEKCILIYEPQNLELARQNGRGWFCTHCRGVCPRKARCVEYNDNNQKRRKKNEEEKRLKREREAQEEENNEPENKKRRQNDKGDDPGDSPTGIPDGVF